ncbi:hypothetical protein PM082_004524 [Marasmius tenuissimus]|nr:hypothetical protein PM082_004524 [Marasmius tenuissimus]
MSSGRIAEMSHRTCKLEPVYHEEKLNFFGIYLERKAPLAGRPKSLRDKKVERASMKQDSRDRWKVAKRSIYSKILNKGMIYYADLR